MTAIFRRAVGSRGTSTVETSWATRWVRCLAAIAMVASVVTVAHAPAAAQTGGFSDVTGGVYKPAVDALAARGTFEGTLCGDDAFCPDDPIKRSTMAVWVVRGLDGADPPPISRSRFDDVDADSFHAPFIERMADLGVTEGCGDGSVYCPDGSVTRAEMAVFFSRAYKLPPMRPGVEYAPSFVDVASDAWYAGHVTRLAVWGITAGCGDGSGFCPDSHTTRAQMATFLARAVGLVETPEPRASDLYTDVHPEQYEEDLHRPVGAVYDAVNRLRALGVLEGTDCGENEFCPDDPVDSKTSAVWLVRVLDGRDAPDFVGRQDAAGTPRFEDVPRTYPERHFIERLAELEITAGCSSKPAMFCPDQPVSRGQMATLVSRALDLPESEPIGFWDVDEDSSHFDHINRLVAAGLDDGGDARNSLEATPCSKPRFVPFNFCPGWPATRGELAELLSEVIDYIEASRIITITDGSDRDNSVNLSVSHNEHRSGLVGRGSLGSRIDVKVTWSNPKNTKGDVSHYILQWRPSWDGFNYRRYQVVEFDQAGRYSIDFLDKRPSRIYAVRIIVAYHNDEKQLATDEVRIESISHQMRDTIKTYIIDAYSQDQPWLVDTWRHLNSNVSLFRSGAALGQVTYTGRGYNWGRLKQTYAGSMTLAGGISLRGWEDRDSSDMGVAVHELGHVYTMTSGIAENAAAIAIGHLYLQLLVRNHETVTPCNSEELYAEMAEVAFTARFSQGGRYHRGPKYWGGYWASCKFNLDQETNDQIARDVTDITRRVFLEQEIPQWFYNEYQEPDGSIDLDKLWADVALTLSRSRSIIVYNLRNEFGGYCSNAEVSRFVAGELDSIDTPWRDAGNCPQ